MPLTRPSLRARNGWRVALLAALAPLAGCDSIIGPDAGEYARLREHRRQWQLLQPYRYEYVLERDCFCSRYVTDPVVVGVTAGAIVSQYYYDDGARVPGDLVGLFPSADGLFGIIEDALDRGADDVAVSYDETWGFPRTIAIDYDRRTADDEVTIRASGFVER